MTDIVSGSSVNLGGYVFYNGWYFKSPRFSWKIRMRPEVSLDARTTLGNTYTMELRAYVTDDINGLASHSTQYSGPATDIQKQTWVSRGNLQKMRSMLSKNGGQFKISGLGFDIDLNTHAAGSMFDTRWGPKTLTLDIDPVGNGVVWEVFWVCEFTLPECVQTANVAPSGNNARTGNFPDVSYIGFPYSQGDIEGVTFTTNFTIDSSGLTTRVIQGIISIAINRAYATSPDGAWNQVTKVADEVREKISPAVPENYQRLQQSWETSEDRRLLRFQIVDKELPGENAYPEGVINISLNHSVSSGGAAIVAAATVVVCQFQGSIEVMKGWPLATAFDKCLLIMQQRINYSIQQERDAIDDDTAQPIVITNVSLSEALYGPRRLTFSVTYMIMSKNPLAILGNYVKRSAMFLEVDVTDVTWLDWSNSLGGSNPASLLGGVLANIGKPWSHRGISGLEFTADQDRIVGPCEGSGGSVLSTGVNPLPSLLGGGTMVTKCPGKRSSYLMWDNEIKVIHDSQATTHYPMTAKGAPPTDVTYITSLADQATIALDFREAEKQRRPRSQDLTANSRVIVCFHGRAARVGLWPELPAISLNKLPKSYRDNEITKFGTDILKHKRYGKIGPCSVFASQWEICYEILNLTAEELETLMEDIEAALTSTVDDSEGTKVDGRTIRTPPPTP